MRITAREVKDYLIITFGLILYVLGWFLFIIPAEITGGGISGVAVVIFYATGFPVWITYLVINIFLVIIAIKILGAGFGLKTIYSIIVTSILFSITGNIKIEPIVTEHFLSAVLGGGAAGLGLGIVFSRGGSTGGTDIIAMIVNKYRSVSPGIVIMICDVVIIGSAFFAIHSLEKLVYGYVVMWVVSYSLDAFLTGANRSAQLFIVSEKYEEIANFINESIYRGVTIMEGQGWYTKKDVKIIMTIIRKRQSGVLFREIKRIDPNAFISMGNVMGVFGRGFDKIKK